MLTRVTTFAMPYISMDASISTHACAGHAPQDFSLDGASRVANKSLRRPIKDAHDDDLYTKARHARAYVL